MSDPLAHPAPEPHPAGPPQGVGPFLDRWSTLHAGVDPRASVLVRSWLTAVHACARPLARARVRPDVLTLLGVGLAVATVPVALAGVRWAFVVAALAALSSLVDSLDGAVAVLSGRVTRWGALLDAVCDRCGDVALTLSLVLLVLPDVDTAGAAPTLVAVTSGAAVLLPLLHEYVRARAGDLGLAGLDVVTVGERPTRLIVVIMFAVGAASTGWGSVAFAGLGVLALLGLVSVLQLLVRLRRAAVGPRG